MTRFFEIEEKLKSLSAAREHGSIPSPRRAARWLNSLMGSLFPQLQDPDVAAPSLESLCAQLSSLLAQLAAPPGDSVQSHSSATAEESATDFFYQLADLQQLMDLDAQAIVLGDPAAESYDEVVVAYPGFYAIAVHRIAHHFYTRGVPVFPRLLSELAHQRTGIDIHPGARIEQSFCIDHGTGVVIGETAVIGRDVKIYQGVTLGALSVDKSLARSKRHPTLMNGVIVYSNATILGGETVIGANSIIGGNVWLTSSVPANSVVYQKSEVTVRDKK